MWLTFLLSFFPQLAQFYFSRYIVFLLSPVEDRNKRLDEKEHHVYHIRAIVVMTIEMIVAMLLFALHFTQFVLVLEIAWCSLAVMLLLGKGKNVFENKKGGSA